MWRVIDLILSCRVVSYRSVSYVISRLHCLRSLVDVHDTQHRYIEWKLKEFSMYNICLLCPSLTLIQIAIFLSRNYSLYISPHSTSATCGCYAWLAQIRIRTFLNLWCPINHIFALTTEKKVRSTTDQWERQNCIQCDYFSCMILED